MVIVNEIFHSFVLGVYDTCNPNLVHGVLELLTSCTSGIKLKMQISSCAKSKEFGTS